MYQSYLCSYDDFLPENMTDETVEATFTLAIFLLGRYLARYISIN